MLQPEVVAELVIQDRRDVEGCQLAAGSDHEIVAADLAETARRAVSEVVGRDDVVEVSLSLDDEVGGFLGQELAVEASGNACVGAGDARAAREGRALAVVDVEADARGAIGIGDAGVGEHGDGLGGSGSRDRVRVCCAVEAVFIPVDLDEDVFVGGAGTECGEVESSAGAEHLVAICDAVAVGVVVAGGGACVGGADVGAGTGLVTVGETVGVEVSCVGTGGCKVLGDVEHGGACGGRAVGVDPNGEGLAGGSVQGE